ncbi:hypothetical protein BDR04DRAFT_1161405 [Suillus decipiens]|nr:hypothetical protein BDR04DRAFT_1161405 [Suillus decipiens]
MPDQYRPGVTLLLTLEQIKLYLQHNADLQGGIEPTTIASPIGYDEFTVALNSNAKNGIQVTLVLEDNTRVCIKGRPPTLAELVGLDATRRVTTAYHNPREEAGGKWLDFCHTELMDKVLWDNINCLCQQRKCVSIKRTKKPSDPSHLQGPPIKLWPDPPTPLTAPAHSNNEDAKMMDSKATEAAKEAMRTRVKGRISKK